MPNIGFWAVAGAGGGGGVPAYELISTAYGTGASGTITFSSIPSDYKHLQIRISARSTYAQSFGENLLLRFNGDTATNYSWHRLRTDGNSTSADSGTTRNNIFASWAASNYNPADYFSATIIDILDYQGIKNKTVRCMNGKNFANEPVIVALISGLWQNTNAISSITLYSDQGANWIAASRFSLYGIKG